MSVSGNAAYYSPTTGPSSLFAEPTGQVFAGIINGRSYGNYVYDTHAAPAGNETPYAHLDGRNLAIGQTSINLGTYFTNVGIGVDGVLSGASLDPRGNGYSINALGQYVLSTGYGATFLAGPAGANDVISSSSQEIAIGLPAAGFTGIAFLGTAVDGVQNGNFTVNYTDGSTSTSFLIFSDWESGYTGPGTVAPYEQIVETMPYIYASSQPTAYQYMINYYIYMHYKL